MKIASGRQHFVKITYNKFNLNRAMKEELRTETSLSTKVKYVLLPRFWQNAQPMKKFLLTLPVPNFIEIGGIIQRTRE
jgi:hypothetical protein